MAFADLSPSFTSLPVLRQSMARGRLGHAYLFTAPALETLETIALATAKTINCLHPIRGEEGMDCCDQCRSCRSIGQHQHPEVQWIRPESKSRVITIEQIRGLRSSIYLKPTQASYKVYIVSAADRMNPHAANAFLKTLEEPPNASILLLLSTDPQRLLDTVASRCLRLNFPGSAEDQDEIQSRDWLEPLSRLMTDPERGLLARYRIIDKLMTELTRVREEIERDLKGRSSLEQYEDLDPKLRGKIEQQLTAAIEAEYRHCRGRMIATLQWFLRDVWLHRVAGQPELLHFPRLEGASRKIAEQLSVSQAEANLQRLESLQQLLSSNVQEALALEVSLLTLSF